MNPMQADTLLNYKNYRYLKITGGMVAAAIGAYVLVKPAAGIAYGATRLGYVFGLAATLIMLVLMWYGVAKRSTPNVSAKRVDSSGIRRYSHVLGGLLDGVTLQEWLSAHVYLGASLLVLASLHSGFHLGWNVHGLSYVLMLLVIASGAYGLFAYLNYPRLITLNMADDTLDNLLLKITELDEFMRVRALGLPDEVNALVLKARLETRVGGTFLQQLNGKQADCPTHLAAQALLRLVGTYKLDKQPEMLRDLYSLVLRKEKLLLRVRTEIMLKARMECWLYLHAPLVIGMLAALAAHIVSIFFYW